MRFHEGMPVADLRGFGGQANAWPSGWRTVANECADRIHAAYSFATVLHPHLPPLAAPKPVSLTVAQPAVPSFTIITTFTAFMLNALLLTQQEVRHEHPRYNRTRCHTPALLWFPRITPL